jgi:phosphohistidine phosphatase
MKNIFLLRHAHSDPNAENDFDRPLNGEGIVKCQNISTNIEPYFNQIDLIMSSPAFRTKQTIENVISLLKQNVNKVIYKKELYSASVNELFQQIATIDDKYQTIMIVSHNPAISQLAMFLDKKNLSPQIIQGFSPGSLALFENTIEFWSELSYKNATLKEFWR